MVRNMIRQTYLIEFNISVKKFHSYRIVKVYSFDYMSFKFNRKVQTVDRFKSQIQTDCRY